MRSVKLFLSLVLVISNFCFVAAQDMGSGPFDLELSSGKYILKISKNVINRDFKVFTRSAKGFAMTSKQDNKKMYAGRELNTVSVRFIIADDGRIQLTKTVNLNRMADTTAPLYKSVEGISKESVIAVFDQLASSSSDTIRIDFTSFIMEDNEFFALTPIYKRMYSLLQYQPAKSVFLFRERFDEGIDFRFSRTYATAEGSKSMDINTTFLLLSEQPMIPRLADYRVTGMGFNTQSFNDYASNPLYVVKKEYAYRYDIHPSEKDKQQYLKGKLVEPAKPIVFYIDPATPREWIPYMKDGIAVWSKTFERAGFKNAVQVREVPAGRQDFNFESGRYNTLVYAPSDSYGGSADLTIDERSGEIINSRIQWPHSNPHHLMKRYMVLSGASDIEARSMHMPVPLVGELIKVVVSHEMGHCLGIHHNYLSSALIPVENLRNKKWVEKNGFTYSIMDYARHNYVAQPEDKIGRAGLIPKLGEYDYWAVEWLYKWYPDQNPTKEKEKLNQLYDLNVKKQPHLQHINIHLERYDHRVQMEDVGDDAVLASEYGIRNLKLVAPNILEWTRDESGEFNHFNALEVYKELALQFRYFMEHVSALIAGTSISLNKNNSMEMTGWVSAKDQKKAVAFIGDQLFNTPEWFLNKKFAAALSNVDMQTSPYELLINIQNNILQRMFDSRKLPVMMKSAFFLEDHYSFDDLMSDVEENIFREIVSAEKISHDRKRLQRKYIEYTESMFKIYGRDIVLAECTAVIRQHLSRLKKMFETQIDQYPDASEKYHLEDLIMLVNRSLASESKG